MTMVPWLFFYLLITVNGVNFFVLNRLIDNPAALTFALSLPGLIFMFVPLGPYISYKSDRIWTGWGRRKPFLLIGFTGMALVLFSYPLAPNIWVFLSLMFLGALFGCFNTPFEALKLEIVPPAMRGRSAAIGTWITTAVNIVFWMFIIGRFDEVILFLKVPLSGDKLIFWSAATGLCIALFVYFFGVHEMQPHSEMTGEKFSFKTMWKSLTMTQLRYLYVFGIAAGLLGANLGALGMLLYINQWGYSLQEMGFNIAVGGIINLFLIPAIGLLADKGKGHNRMKIWLTCLTLILLLNVSYFSYVTWYLPDQRPSLVEIIFFGEITAVASIVAGVVYYPLVYDYVPRNLMGTYFAGISILSGITGFLSVNGLGMFLLGWATLFQPPAGEMARVCLKQELNGAEVARMVSAVGVSTPDGVQAGASDIVVHPWFANGIVQDTGICHEIRLRDAIGEAKRQRLETAKKESEAMEAKKVAADTPKFVALREEIATLTAEVNRRKEAWGAEVQRALAGKLIESGEETFSTACGQAVTALLPTQRKPRESEVDKLTHALRLEIPDFVALRTVSQGHSFYLLVSSLLPTGTDKDSTIASVCDEVVRLSDSLVPGLLAPNAVCTQAQVQPAVTAEIALVENPAPAFVSPISRVVNSVLSLVTTVPATGQKLVSLARTLGAGEGMGAARVESLPGRNGLRVLKVLPAAATDESPSALAAKLVEQVRTEGASLKLTVPAPLVDQGLVPVQYNYMVGYIYVFTMVLLGFVLVAVFLLKEKAGIVRKLGAEEVEAESAQAEERKKLAEENPSQVTPATAIHTYTPGFLVPKLLFAAIGLAAMALAFSQAWPHLRLFVHGQKAEAVAVSVLVTKPSQPSCQLATQAELEEKSKEVRNAKDYKWTFYNVFRFETPDGREITFQREVGCKLKPSIPLLDQTGLPSTSKLLYDPKDPTCAVLPLEFSSWFVPGLVGLFGFAAFLVGATLAWFARKPIPIRVE
jgi:MFS family permease